MMLSKISHVFIPHFYGCILQNLVINNASHTFLYQYINHFINYFNTFTDSSSQTQVYHNRHIPFLLLHYNHKLCKGYNHVPNISYHCNFKAFNSLHPKLRYNYNVYNIIQFNPNSKTSSNDLQAKRFHFASHLAMSLQK